MTNYQIEAMKVALQAAIYAAQGAAKTKLGGEHIGDFNRAIGQLERFAEFLDETFDLVETFGDEADEEHQEISPEEARIRYYESQADIAREEADDGE